MTEYTAISTRTGASHRLFANGTVCNPNKLPKGELFVEGELVEVQAWEWENGKLVEVTREVARKVTCHRCNKVDHKGSRR